MKIFKSENKGMWQCFLALLAWNHPMMAIFGYLCMKENMDEDEDEDD